MTPKEIKELCEVIGMDQAELARGFPIPPATWYRYMKDPEGRTIPTEVKNYLIALQSVIQRRDKLGLQDSEIKDAIKLTGVTGVIARATLAGALPYAVMCLLAANPLTAWTCALMPLSRIAIGGIGAVAGLSLFQKLKPKKIQKEKTTE
jgi:hypothetical protein